MSTTPSRSIRAAPGVARRRQRFSMLQIDPATVKPTSLLRLAPPGVAAAGTLAAVLLLCLTGTSPAAGGAGGGEPQAQAGGDFQTVRSSSGPLGRGASYAVEGGSTRIRQLQRRLGNGGYA